MKAGGGRNKGSAFERKVAKLIIATFANKGINKEDCYRTPGSGGHRFASKTDPGDLVLSPALRELFNFSVECKHYAKLDWGVLLSNRRKKGQFESWWRQCCKAAVDDAIPLLVFKRNNGNIYAMYRAGSLHDLEFCRDSFRPDTYAKTYIGKKNVRIVLFAELLEWMKLED